MLSRVIENTFCYNLNNENILRKVMVQERLIEYIVKVNIYY